MSEWLKEHAWKACVGKLYRGFESHSLRQIPQIVQYFEDSAPSTILSSPHLNDRWDVYVLAPRAVAPRVAIRGYVASPACRPIELSTRQMRPLLVIHMTGSELVNCSYGK